MPKQHINSIVSDLFFNHQHPQWDEVAMNAWTDEDDEREALLVEARQFITDYAAIIPLLQDIDLASYAEALVADFMGRL